MHWKGSWRRIIRSWNCSGYVERRDDNTQSTTWGYPPRFRFLLWLKQLIHAVIYNGTNTSGNASTNSDKNRHAQRGRQQLISCRNGYGSFDLHNTNAQPTTSLDIMLVISNPNNRTSNRQRNNSTNLTANASQYTDENHHTCRNCNNLIWHWCDPSWIEYVHILPRRPSNSIWPLPHTTYHWSIVHKCATIIAVGPTSYEARSVNASSQSHQASNTRKSGSRNFCSRYSSRGIEM